MKQFDEITPIKGLTATGDVVWYTGRAGNDWVSSDRADAFKFTLERARRQASAFNKMTAIHGIRFVAVSAVTDDDSTEGK